ncbi:MAG: hypothetical protein ABI837_10390, partial [Acidobacteriota bacterium]
KPGQIGTNYFYSFPLMIAAIDPKAEAQLVGLKGAVTSGRYLTERDPIRRADRFSYAPKGSRPKRARLPRGWWCGAAAPW